MNKARLAEITVNVCIVFTIIQFSNAIINVICRQEMQRAEYDVFLILAWSLFGTCMVYTYTFVEKKLPYLSPLSIFTLLYIVAVTLVLSSIWIQGHFMKMHPDAYRDGFRSFSLFYIIGSIWYYIENRRYIDKQNKALTYIKNHKINKNK